MASSHAREVSGTRFLNARFATDSLESAKYIETQRKTIAIWIVPCARGKMQLIIVQVLQRLQHRSVVLLQKPVGNVDPEIRIDPNEMSVEGSMMDLRKRNSIWHDRLPPRLALVGNDVRRIKQPLFGQSRDRTTSVICGNHRLTE